MTTFNRIFSQGRPGTMARTRIMLLAILVLSLVLGVASRQALAATENDPINGCYDSTNGNLRIADGPCRNNEISLSWPSMSDFEALQAALADETAQREAADAALQDALAQETTERQAADAEFDSALADETAQRQDADANLRAENAALADQIAALQAQLDTEISNRQAGDAALQTALNTEIDNRIAGDSQTLAGAIAHANDSVANEATERQSLQIEMSGTVKAIVQVIGALMTTDWDSAWQSLLALAKERLPEQVWQTLESIGNMLGPVIDNITATIDGIVGKVQEIWEFFFGENPKEAN